MRSMTIADPNLRAAVDDYARGDHRHIDPRTADIRYRQGSAGRGGPPDPARHGIVARGQRAAGPCPLPRFCEDARGSEVAEHRARHRRRADRDICVAAGGSPHRASACRDRKLDPRGGPWRKERLDPGDRRGQRDRRHCPRGRSVPANAGRRRRGARGGGARARRTAACRGKLPQAVRVLGRRNLRHDARRRAAERQPGAGADDGLCHAAGSDQRHRRHRRYGLCPSRGAGGIRAADAARRHGP